MKTYPFLLPFFRYFFQRTFDKHGRDCLAHELPRFVKGIGGQGDGRAAPVGNLGDTGNSIAGGNIADKGRVNIQSNGPGSD